MQEACLLPFCQVMAGRGAPEVSQCRITDMPSITVLSEGPAVMLGAIPGKQEDRFITWAQPNQEGSGVRGERVAGGKWLSPTPNTELFSLSFSVRSDGLRLLFPLDVLSCLFFHLAATTVYCCRCSIFHREIVAGLRKRGVRKKWQEGKITNNENNTICRKIKSPGGDTK